MGQPRARERRLVTKFITVPGNLRRACVEFNGGLFFECHETFEEIWQEEQGPVRDLYKGLIQVAAAFVHLSRGKFIGGDRLLRTGTGYLAPYRADGAMGFDVDRICRGAQAMHARLIAGGPTSVAALDLALRPRYACDESQLPAEAVRWGAWGFDDDGRPLEMEITVIE